MTFRYLAGALCAALLTGPAFAEGPRSIIVMDGSGSMWGQIEGRTKLEIARETLTSVLATIPPTQELGLMAYGHREKGNCSDIELMVPPVAGTGAEIAARVSEMRFQGKTPLSESVRQAAESLQYSENPATVVLVTDGLETCDADPCALGRELEVAGLDFTAHVIGFGLTGAEGAQVACLATETGGQYLQASDAQGLSNALSATVKAQLPPPQPPPVPEPEPVLPKAALTAPSSAPAGSVLRVGFEGPHEEFDYIRVLDANGDWQSEAVVGEEAFIDMRLPFELGDYELVYLYRASDVIARQPLQITEAAVTLSAPETAPAGSTILVDWTGPNAEYDYITLLNEAGEKMGEVSLANGSPSELGLPWATGNFTLNYLFQSQDVIASQPITLTEAEVSIAAPDTAEVGSDVTITWVGPKAVYDNIQLYRQSDDMRIEYRYVADLTEMTFTMPNEAGIFEFRYLFRDSEVIHTRPITLTLEKVEAAPQSSLVPVTVSLSVPTEFAGQPIMWSAEPLNPHPDAPEALAMPEAISGIWQAELYQGTWRIYGEAPAGVTAGQGFAADITVTDAAGQTFEIPLTPLETMGMGEDPPSGDVVPISIKGEYNGIFTRWQATPMGGQSSEVFASDFVQGGWQTALDPGRWLIEGFAEGAENHLYAGVIDLAQGGAPELTLARTASATSSPPALPSGDAAQASCAASAACFSADTAGGLSYLLLPEWLASPALFYETAAGVAATSPSVDFYAGTPMQVMAALNPRQWDATLGPCADTAMGALCSAQDADPAAIALLRASIKPLPPAPAIPGASIDLSPEASEALRALLEMGTP